MNRFTLGCLGLVVGVLGVAAQVWAQPRPDPDPDPYAQSLRQATSVGIAITFLEHERERAPIDAVRRHKNVTLMVGNQRVTPDNVEAFAKDNERKLQLLAAEIQRRGSSSAAGEYAVQTAVAQDKSPPACAKPQEHFGPLTLRQDGSSIELRDAAGQLSGWGVVVEHSLAVIPGARDRVSPITLIGTMDGSDITLSLYDGTPAALHPGAQPALCRLGIANALAATH